MPDAGDPAPRPPVSPTPLPAAVPAATPAPPAPRARRRLLRLVLFALGPIALALVGGWFYATGGRFVGTDNAYLRAARVSISADVAGRVVAVAVRESQAVAAGDLLFRIDDEPFRIALARADAQLAGVRNDIEALRASFRSKQEQVRLAETTVGHAEREFERQNELLRRDATPRRTFDDSRQAVAVARQQLGMARQDLAQIMANLGGAPDLPVGDHPRYREALAQRDQAALDLRRTTVTAPAAGVVSRIDRFRPGDYVTAGVPVFALVATEGLWVEANVKETDLTHVRPGQEASVTIDAYPGIVWRATVASISAGTGGEFSVLPAQNATGNWVKVVQRVPVQLRLAPLPGQPPLRAGLSVVVEIDTGHRRPLPALVRAVLAWTGHR